MKCYALKRRVAISKPPDQVFSFFSRPENLELLTPHNLRFQMLTPSPIPMKEGTLIDYAMRLFGAPFRWTSCITEFHPPQRFADVQVRGPYSFWHHTHSFQAAGEGTLMTDEVSYAMPFGFLGKVAHGIFVRRQLDKIFTYRERKVKAIFDEDVKTVHQQPGHGEPSTGEGIGETDGVAL